MTVLRTYPLDTNDYLYFHHIPKTGGQTLQSILETLFKPEEICPARLWKQLIQIPREELLQYHLFGGHFYYYINELLPHDPITITMLRDPMIRSISHYQHIRRVSFLYYHDRSASADLLSFITDPLTRPQIENFQTKLIALSLDPSVLAQAWGEENLEGYRLNHFDHWLELPCRLSNDALLERAKTRLEQLAFVGLTEQYSESLLLLGYTLHRNIDPNYDKKNVDPEEASSMEVLPVVREALEEATQLDTELYSYAQQLFQERFRQMVTNLRSENFHLEQEIISVRTEIVQAEQKVHSQEFASEIAVTNDALDQHLEHIHHQFHEYDIIRTRADYFRISRLPGIGLFIRIFLRLAYAGKVWAAERQLLYEMVSILRELRKTTHE